MVVVRGGRVVRAKIVLLGGPEEAVVHGAVGRVRKGGGPPAMNEGRIGGVERFQGTPNSSGMVVGMVSVRAEAWRGVHGKVRWFSLHLIFSCLLTIQ